MVTGIGKPWQLNKFVQGLCQVGLGPICSHARVSCIHGMELKWLVKIKTIVFKSYL